MKVPECGVSAGEFDEGQDTNLMGPAVAADRAGPVRPGRAAPIGGMGRNLRPLFTDRLTRIVRAGASPALSYTSLGIRGLDAGEGGEGGPQPLSGRPLGAA